MSNAALCGEHRLGGVRTWRIYVWRDAHQAEREATL
jgi:hypothetical protein